MAGAYPVWLLLALALCGVTLGEDSPGNTTEATSTKLPASAEVTTPSAHLPAKLCHLVPLFQRLDCGYERIPEQECTDRGCCFEKVVTARQVQCFFPVGCRRAYVAAGTSTAFLVLPGDDDRGHFSMLETGGWCARSVALPPDSISIQLDLDGPKRVHVLTGKQHHHLLYPFHIMYRSRKRGQWKTRNLTASAGMVDRNYIHGFSTAFTATEVKLKPVDTAMKGCTRFEVVTCPGKKVPAPTFPAPTQTAGRPYYMNSDDRPVAICMGVIAMITLFGVLAVLIFLDTTTYATNLVFMKSNIAQFVHSCHRRGPVAKAGAKYHTSPGVKYHTSPSLCDIQEEPA